LLNVSWKSPGNLLDWICRHPVVALWHVDIWNKWERHTSKDGARPCGDMPCGCPLQL